MGAKTTVGEHFKFIVMLCKGQTGRGIARDYKTFHLRGFFEKRESILRTVFLPLKKYISKTLRDKWVTILRYGNALFSTL